MGAVFSLGEAVGVGKAVGGATGIANSKAQVAFGILSVSRFISPLGKQEPMTNIMQGFGV